MPEQNEQDILLQNQSNENEGSDMVRQDGGILNGNRNNDEGNGTQNNKKRFDLLGSTYEDSIWNTNLDGNEKGKDIPKNYPGKKRRNARAIVLIIDVILSMIGFLTIGLEILSTVLMVVFLVLWIKTIRTPENQEIIKERNIGKRLKGIIRLYAIFTAMYVINDINFIANIENETIEYKISDVQDQIKLKISSHDLAFYNDNKTFIDDEIIKVANEYAKCNCFGNNATQTIKDGFTSTEFENFMRKVSFDIAIENFLYNLKQSPQFGNIVKNHEDDIRNEVINSVNTIMGRNCFGSYIEACDLLNVDMDNLWEKTYMDAVNKIAPKIDNGEWK